MSDWPSWQHRSKAIRVPSGDHAGWPSIQSFVVRRCSPVPSAFTTYSSGNASGFDRTNAIRAPSGDHVGLVSEALFQGLVTWWGNEPPGPMTQMWNPPKYP